MATRLTLVYDSLEQAERGRAGLIDAGFATGDVELSVQADEAGPVEGNFLLGNGRAATRGVGDPTAYQPYEHNFRRVTERGTVVLSIAVDEGRRRDEAATIAARFGGRALP